MATATKKKPAKPRGGTSDEPPEADTITIPVPGTEGNATLTGPRELLEGLEAEPVPTLAETVDTVLDNVTPSEPIDYASPEKLAEYDAETVSLTDQAEGLTRHYESIFDKLHAETAAAKKVFERSVEDMRDFVRDRRNARGKPPQPKPAKLYPDPKDSHWVDHTDNREPGEVPAVDDSWKSVPLADLVDKDGLPAKVAQLLGDAGINTLGELAAYSEPAASGYTKKLTDIAGIGPAKADAIEAATAAFWSRRNAEQAQAADAGPTSEDRGTGGDEPADVGAGDDTEAE